MSVNANVVEFRDQVVNLEGSWSGRVLKYSDLAMTKEYGFNFGQTYTFPAFSDALFETSGRIIRYKSPNTFDQSPGRLANMLMVNGPQVVETFVMTKESGQYNISHLFNTAIITDTLPGNIYPPYLRWRIRYIDENGAAGGGTGWYFQKVSGGWAFVPYSAGPYDFLQNPAPGVYYWYVDNYFSRGFTRYWQVEVGFDVSPYGNFYQSAAEDGTEPAIWPAFTTERSVGP